MSSEFERIARIRAVLEGSSPDVLLGIGDDCAVLAPSARPRVWTVDSAVEGVHFSRAFMSLEHVGYRAFMAATSDVAAMGARAVAALSSLILPASLDDSALDMLVRGLAKAAAACDCPIVGGNLARGTELSVTTSVIGEAHGRVIERQGARPGDHVYVTGPLGASALGLRALDAGQGAEPRLATFVRAFLEPRARLDVAETLADIASSAIDISDGLAQDLGHLCEASNVVAHVELARVPTLAGFEAACAALSLAPADLVLGGGEDYELLFTAAPSSVSPALATDIGHLGEGPAGVLVTLPDGRVVRPSHAGFDHFRERVP